MSHGGGGGGGGGGSCAASVSLGKYVRCVLRKASGRKRIKDKRPGGGRAVVDGGGGGGVSVELMSSSSSEARRETVVRVVLSGGVVEVYTGVVLACTVIRKHPPGLCLVHPDVFRNPHGARVRPLEPLLPGQKFFLLPESTIERLQRNIPEGSVGAFDDDEEEEANDDEEVTTSTETETETSSSEGKDEEERETGDDDGDGGCVGVRNARGYFVARDLWAECHFRKMVARGLAAEQSTEPERKDGKPKRKKKTKKKKGKKRKDPAAVPSRPGAGCRTVRFAATPRRTWEPSLPSVEEEERSPLHINTPSETRTDHETS